MNWFRSIAEEKIKEAIERGEFDNLSGFGKPLPPDQDPWLMGQAWRMVHTRRVRYMVERAMIDLAGNPVGPSLEQAARAYPYPPKVKSRRLPNGTIGSRTVPARLEVVDEEAALRWAEEHGFDGAIRKSVRVTPLREYWQSTGIVPDGCQEVPAEERFYVNAGGA